MDLEAYVGALRREADVLAVTALADLDARVPSCPAWSVEELVWHVGAVHHLWREIVRRRLTDRTQVATPPRPERHDLLPWFRSGVEELAVVLLAADPSTPVWTWASQRDVAFVQRRVAHETAVHRWDAQAAVGVPDPLDAPLAADGIDEFLDLILPRRPKHLEGPRDLVHLHASDADRGFATEWLIEVGEGAVRVIRGHGKGDVAVRAPVSDLLLLLWRRIPPEETEVLGDPACLRRFLARTELN